MSQRTYKYIPDSSTVNNIIPPQTANASEATPPSIPLPIPPFTTSPPAAKASAGTTAIYNRVPVSNPNTILKWINVQFRDRCLHRVIEDTLAECEDILEGGGGEEGGTHADAGSLGVEGNLLKMFSCSRFKGYGGIRMVALYDI